MKAPYRTRQQSDLLDYLKETCGKHHTAAELKEHFACCGKTIGTATIYRQLDRLVDEGQVRRYVLETGDSACYEYVESGNDCGSHFHLKCEKCGRLIHLDCEELQAIREHLLEHHGFQWTTGKTVFYGICDQCRKG